MKNQWKKIICMLLVLTMVFTAGSYAQAKTVTCNTLYTAALKATGNKNKLNQKTTLDPTDPANFSALTSKSLRNKVKNILYFHDGKEIYSLCVMEATKSADAKTLLNAVKKYKKNNTSNNYYLSDYTKTEQQVLKNAVCGKKGKYVWYIAMSAKKADNTKGQTAIKKKL